VDSLGCTSSLKNGAHFFKFHFNPSPSSFPLSFFQRDPTAARACACAAVPAFIGRISPEKRVDRDIEIAQRALRKLRIAAKVDVVDEEYFHAHIEPLLNHPLVESSANRRARKRKFGSPAIFRRLEGADWPSHDRSHGLWLPGDRFPDRLDAGGH
jgi:glycosyltransferase involved in cell wall biosynthesis